MRKRSQIITWSTYALVVGWLAVALPLPGVPAALSFLADLLRGPATAAPSAAPTPAPAGARAWFAEARPHCNPVEVGLHLDRRPPPRGMEGTGYAAACLSLAGEVDEARARIRALEGDDRWMAAGIVFRVAHQVADAGREVAAGPAMELVVEFWPNHYQALYHAGAARFEAGDREGARPYLTRFLETYEGEDAWRDRGERMLAEIEAG